QAADHECCERNQCKEGDERKDAGVNRDQDALIGRRSPGGARAHANRRRLEAETVLPPIQFCTLNCRHRLQRMPNVSRQTSIALFCSGPLTIVSESTAFDSSKVGGTNFIGATPGLVTGRPSCSCSTSCPGALISQLTKT